MKEKIKEIEKRLCICGPEYTDRGLTSPYCVAHEFATDVNDYFDLISKNIQVPVECPSCLNGIIINAMGSGTDDLEYCDNCQGTGKTLRPATPEEMKKGGILREVKE